MPAHCDARPGDGGARCRNQLPPEFLFVMKRTSCASLMRRWTRVASTHVYCRHHAPRADRIRAGRPLANSRRGRYSAFANCKGDDDVDPKRSQPVMENPLWAIPRLRRVFVFGTDRGSLSGPAATVAASRWRQAFTRKQAAYMAAPEHFAKRQIPLAPRAPSIHGPSRPISY